MATISTKDFWQDFTIEAVPAETPVGLLVSQANMLPQKTSSLLKGEVSTYTEQNIIYNTFYIVAPRLDHYRYALIQVVSGPALYPVYVYDRSGVDYTPHSVTVKFPNITAAPKLPKASFAARDYEDFEKAVKAILSSEETAGIIRSLMSQSKALQSVPTVLT
jgi:hypothetical protein